jgi:hypothetical protein
VKAAQAVNAPHSYLEPLVAGPASADAPHGGHRPTDDALRTQQTGQRARSNRPMLDHFRPTIVHIP